MIPQLRITPSAHRITCPTLESPSKLLVNSCLELYRFLSTMTAGGDLAEGLPREERWHEGAGCLPGLGLLSSSIPSTSHLTPTHSTI